MSTPNVISHPLGITVFFAWVSILVTCRVPFMITAMKLNQPSL